MNELRLMRMQDIFNLNHLRSMNIIRFNCARKFKKHKKIDVQSQNKKSNILYKGTFSLHRQTVEQHGGLTLRLDADHVPD